MLNESENWAMLIHNSITIFDLCYVANHYVSHQDLDNLASTDHSESLLLLDAVLEPTELLLFAPVIEGSHQHHHHDRQEDSSTLDPACICLPLVLNPSSRPPTICSTSEHGNQWQNHVNNLSSGHWKTWSIQPSTTYSYPWAPTWARPLPELFAACIYTNPFNFTSLQSTDKHWH